MDELMIAVKGPDFPTGGQILGLEGVRSAYRTGRGAIFSVTNTPTINKRRVDKNIKNQLTDLLCGIGGRFNLSHVVDGSRRLDEVVVSLRGPSPTSRRRAGASMLIMSTNCRYTFVT